MTCMVTRDFTFGRDSVIEVSNKMRLSPYTEGKRAVLFYSGRKTNAVAHLLYRIKDLVEQ